MACDSVGGKTTRGWVQITGCAKRTNRSAAPNNAPPSRPRSNSGPLPVARRSTETPPPPLLRGTADCPLEILAWIAFSRPREPGRRPGGSRPSDPGGNSGERPKPKNRCAKASHRKQNNIGPNALSSSIPQPLGRVAHLLLNPRQ